MMKHPFPSATVFPAWLKRGGETILSHTRVALAGAIVLALLHYTFGEWVFHPGLPLWRERAFWADMPWIAIVPILNWLAWVVISLGRINAARIAFLIYAVAFVGNFIWFPLWRNAGVFRLTLSSNYWYWWTYWLPAVLVIGNLVIARQWWKESRCSAAVPAASSGGVPPPEGTPSETPCEPAGEGAGATSRAKVRRPQHQLTGLETGLRLAAVFVGAWAVLLTAVHLVTPRLPVNDLTLDLADEFLLRPEQKPDFDFILQTAPCRGKRLGAVLQHVELANLQRSQFYKDLADGTFQQFILSPIVDTLPLQELDWRRSLWENFYPRIRRESDPASAANVVVRFLRERVGISPDYPYRVGVETIWTQGMTDEAGFERIYVAALRSVGIAARLNGNRQAELLANGQWQPAPRPLITTF